MRRRRSYSYWDFPTRTPVRDLKAKALHESQQQEKKKGQPLEGVRVQGRTIATSFWGKAWCTNLEAYSDFENRLPRGRTYLRGGMVIDLKIEPGVVRAQVQGRSLYRISIKIDPVPASRWEAIRQECSGRIDSLVALLNGKLSHPVMEVVTRNGTGLFPSPKEIKMDCSCPDWAGLCKHLAAVLYGIGARLDQKPELLFLLRKVDHSDLITNPFVPEAVAAKGEELAASELSSIFGIDIPEVPNPPSAAAPDRLLEASPAPKEAKPRIRTPRKRERAAPSSILSKQEQPGFGTITYHELAAEGVSPRMIQIWLSMGVIRPPVEFGRYERTSSTAIHLEAHRQALKARAAKESAPGEGPRRTAIPRQKGSKPG